MSIFVSVAKSHPLSMPATIAARSLTTHHCGSSHDDNSRMLRRSSGIQFRNRRTTATRSAQWSDLENRFINSLVIAGSCAQHRSRKSLKPVSSSQCRPLLALPSNLRSARIQQRCSSQLATVESDGEDPAHDEKRSTQDKPTISQAEYKQLVDTYETGENRRDIRGPAERKRDRHKQHFPLAPRLVKDSTPGYQENLVSERLVQSPQNQEHAHQLVLFKKIVYQPIGYLSHDVLWDAYEALPGPRVQFLETNTIKRIFGHLAYAEFKDESSMKRYFSLLNDCVEEKIALRTVQWNSAVHAAGRWMQNVSSGHLQDAVKTWLQMENHGRAANHITINILFDIAIRAERFALADTFFEELKARGSPLDRYFRTSFIYYAGLRHDGDGVRQAFKDFVEAGEIVDTTVLNCVIVSFIMAQEPAAAESVFLKMKWLNEEKFGTGTISDWRSTKKMNRLLNEQAYILRRQRDNPKYAMFPFDAHEKLEQIQNSVPIGPNATTYRTLIKYHAEHSGNLNRIRELLAEMRERQFMVTTAVFRRIFSGFHQHGGFAFSAWDRDSLERLWNELLAAITQGDMESTNPQEISTPLSEASTLATDMKSTESSKSQLGTHSFPQSSDHADQDYKVRKPPRKDLDWHDRPPRFDLRIVRQILKAYYNCSGARRALEISGVITRTWTDISQDDQAELGYMIRRLKFRLQKIERPWNSQ